MPIYTSRQLLDPTYITNQMKNQAQSEKDTWNALASIGKDVSDWYKENRKERDWYNIQQDLLKNEEFKDDNNYKALVYQAAKNRDMSPVTNYVNTIRQQKSTEKMAQMNAEQEKLKGVYDAQTSFNQAKDAYNYSKAKGDVEGMNNALDSMKRANRQSTWYGGPEFELPTSQFEITSQSDISIVETPEQIAAKEKERTDKITEFETKLKTLNDKQPKKGATRADIIAWNKEVNDYMKELESAGLTTGDLKGSVSLMEVPPSREEIEKRKKERLNKLIEAESTKVQKVNETIDKYKSVGKPVPSKFSEYKYNYFIFDPNTQSYILDPQYK